MTDKRYKPSKTAERVLSARYLLKDEAGNVVETPEEMFRRVARHVASAERVFDPTADVTAVEDQFFQSMAGLEFLPNSPTLMNAGTAIGQLAACFVLPLGDSMEDIFETAKSAAMVFKSGGGVGLSFSRLRPRGDAVRSTGGVASGPVSFMHVFDTGADVVKQGGRRRGAMLGALRVDHPDILEFVRCKRDPGQLTSFNISVAVTDAFMAALAEDGEYDLLNPRTGAPAGRLRASEVLDEIVRRAHATGEPGILFIDRMNASNPTPALGLYEATNPCGETQLLPYESCNLGSINLARMVAGGDVDQQRLSLATRVATRFLDNVIELNEYPLPEIAELSRANRKIGLGVMGFAEMLVQLGVPYDSDEALQVARYVIRCIDDASLEESRRLAEVRGPFPNFQMSSLAGGPPVRNATRLAVAPTGTLSIIAGVSGGIEPVFAVALRRGNILDGSEFFEVHPLFEEFARDRGIWSDELAGRFACTASIQHVEEIPEDIRRLFRTAHGIAPEWHVRMQAAFQECVDNSVSKTVNLPAEATPDEVRRIFLLAYELGCKGITVYRDGSRAGQPLSTGTPGKPKQRKPRPRPDVLSGQTRKLRTGCGNIFVTITTDDRGRPLELFAKHGKAGVCSQAQCEAIGRLVSLALRSDVASEEIEKQLAGITCHAPFGFGPDKVLSCADAIARALRLDLSPPSHEGRGAREEPTHTKQVPMGACPECGAALAQEGHCASCRSCGFTRCG